jgi:hypothetical protein
MHVVQFIPVGFSHRDTWTLPCSDGLSGANRSCANCLNHMGRNDSTTQRGTTSISAIFIFYREVIFLLIIINRLNDNNLK